jgi:hypothetical protein
LNKEVLVEERQMIDREGQGVMSGMYGDELLLQTVVQTDVELSEWVRRLSSDYYLELGADPSLVSGIEQDLRSINRRMGQLRPRFDISRVPLKRAREYFAATQSLQDAIALVRDIHDEAHGSRRSTRQCIDLLRACVERVRHLASHVAQVG